jgi:hypothetical protein
MKNWVPPKRHQHIKTTARMFNIPAVVYYSVWYQNGIKNPSRVPKALDI